MTQASRKPTNQGKQGVAAPVSALVKSIDADPGQMRAKPAQTPFRSSLVLPPR